ncbi:MAG: cytochrome b/b6 domain-containing protein [Desulfobacterales bacterium]
MNIIHIIYGYLRERQPPAVRFLHITILCLVLSQIIVSNFMGFTDNGEISKKAVEYYGTWIHIATGLSLLPLTFVFVYIELKRHGIKYFFPYFYGDFSQLKKDLTQLKQFELPEPSAYGIAVIVQGLGLGALTLVILSGFTWFLSWIYMAPWAESIKEIHELLTGLIEAYVLGHGGMGMLHLFFHWKNQKNR